LTFNGDKKKRAVSERRRNLSALVATELFRDRICVTTGAAVSGSSTL